jgi:hypothetical protein
MVEAQDANVRIIAPAAARFETRVVRCLFTSGISSGEEVASGMSVMSFSAWAVM